MTTGQHHKAYPLSDSIAPWDSDTNSGRVKSRRAHISHQVRERAETGWTRARSQSGAPVTEPRILALEAPKLGAEKHIEHVCGRTAHHIRK